MFGHSALSSGESIQGIVLSNWVSGIGEDTIYSSTGHGQGGLGELKETFSDLEVSVTSNGESGLRYILSSAQTNVELLGIRLSTGLGDDRVINRIKLSLIGSGIASTDISNIRIVLDPAANGTYNVGTE